MLGHKSATKISAADFLRIAVFFLSFKEVESKLCLNFEICFSVYQSITKCPRNSIISSVVMRPEKRTFSISNTGEEVIPPGNFVPILLHLDIRQLRLELSSSKIHECEVMKR